MDINENFINLAKKKYPDCTFKVMNADDDQFEGFYDYIFICGVFNLKVPGVEDDLKNALVQLFKHCNKGLALSALSSHTPDQGPRAPFHLAGRYGQVLLENLSPSVALRHDRIQHDFTLFVYTSYNEVDLSL